MEHTVKEDVAMQARECLFASFILERETELEIALPAEQVVEATPLAGAVKPIPSSADFLEGLMTLRKDVIPIINLKKRLGLEKTTYGEDAKVAVINLAGKRYGLLFEDIRDVVRVGENKIEQLDRILLSEDTIITDLIKLEDGRRTLEILDLEKLFPCGAREVAEKEVVRKAVKRTYKRYVLFACRGQTYGVPVEESQEICFFSDLDTMFKTGEVEGALQLRGSTIPVLCSAVLLGCSTEDKIQADEHTRILVLNTGELTFGLVVDTIHRILVVADDEVLPVPGNSLPFLHGVCRGTEGEDVLLLDVMDFIDSQIEKIKAMARITRKSEEEENRSRTTLARHVITENCYLIFSIGKNYAIELKDVQEILDTDAFLRVPASTGLIAGIINLRGVIVPVMDLRRFIGCHGEKEEDASGKLIIGRVEGCRLALLVDEIVTIFKQEQFHKTPSLRPELQGKQDCLDRLIEFINEEDLLEHVLVINVENILKNHLRVFPGMEEATTSGEPFVSSVEDGGQGIERIV